MKCNTVTKKVVLMLSFGIVCLLVLGSISLGKDIPSETKETNYVGLVNLGLAPNTFMREPTPRDINTGEIIFNSLINLRLPKCNKK